MKFHNNKTFTARVRLVFASLFLLVFIPLIAGCSTFSSIEKTTKRIARNIKAPDDDFKKRVALSLFENKTVFADQNFEQSFLNKLIETLKASCSDIILVKPGDAGYPDFLVELPRQPSGWIDNFDLAKTGRQLGLNAILTGAIIDVRKNKEEKGFWLFKDIHHFVELQIMVEVYDTQTGAKLLDESFIYKIEVDEADLEATSAASEIWASVINEAFEHIAANMGEQVCDAVVLQPWNGYITSITTDNIIISSGKEVGLKPGDIFEVYDSNGIFQGAEDQKFFIPGLKIGEIKITAVYADRSEAIRISDQDIQEGSSIRLKD